MLTNSGNGTSCNEISGGIGIGAVAQVNRPVSPIEEAMGMLDNYIQATDNLTSRLEGQVLIPRPEKDSLGEAQSKPETLAEHMAVLAKRLDGINSRLDYIANVAARQLGDFKLE